MKTVFGTRFKTACIIKFIGGTCNNLIAGSIVKDYTI